MEDLIKRKRDMKRLYIQVLKKSGFGYRINYAPGQKQKTTKLEVRKPKPKGPTYEDLLKKILIAEGLKEIEPEP